MIFYERNGTRTNPKKLCICTWPHMDPFCSLKGGNSHEIIKTHFLQHHLLKCPILSYILKLPKLNMKTKGYTDEKKW